MILAVSVVSYQNCSKVDFVEDESLLPLCLVDEQNCVEHLLDTKTLVETEKVKIILVIDNSYSMAEIQAKVGSAMGDLIVGLEENELEFYIFTTTQISSGMIYQNYYQDVPGYGQRPITKNKRYYTYTLNGISQRSDEMPEEVNAENIVQHSGFGLNIVPLQILAPKNAISENPAYEQYDVNQDGYLDFNDFYDLINDCNSEAVDCSANADFNDDGIINSRDYIAMTALMQENGHNEIANYFSNPQSESEYVDLKILPTMSHQLRKYYLSKIARRVHSLGVSGSDIETGICNLNKIVYEQENPILQQGDKVAFLVVSNEEDHSTARNCIKEVEYDVIDGSATVSCDPNVETCTSIRYQMTVERSPMLNAQCVTDYKDGTTEPETRNFFDIWEKTVCDYSQTLDCTPEQATAAAAICNERTGQGTLYSCNIKCEIGAGVPVSSNLINFSRYHNEENKCSPDEIFMDGLNIYDYYNTRIGTRILKPETCNSSYFKRITTRTRSNGSQRVEQMFPSLGSDDQLIDRFIDGANSLLGRGNYFLSTIVHKPGQTTTAGCEVGAAGSGSSYGNRYISLAQKVMGRDASMSLCESSFKPAIEEIKNFTTSSTIRVYDISQYGVENIDRVGVRRNSNSFRLTEEQYSINGSQLTIAEGVLQPGDQIVLASVE